MRRHTPQAAIFTHHIVKTDPLVYTSSVAGPYVSSYHRPQVAIAGDKGRRAAVILSDKAVGQRLRGQLKFPPTVSMIWTTNLASYVDLKGGVSIERHGKTICRPRGSIGNTRNRCRR